MAENPADEMSASWCVVERRGGDEDAAVEVAAASVSGRESPEQNTEAPISLLLAGETDSSGLPSPVATPSDGLEMSDTGSSGGGDASSDHSDFEVFEQDCGEPQEEGPGQEEDEEEEEAEGASARKDSLSASTASHEERIRLALDNLRSDDPQQSVQNQRQPTPLALEPAIEAAPTLAVLRQVAEPPRVQIIRHNAEEESLPESDIQLEDAQETVPGLSAHEHYELLMEGDRVRRYQHLPNPNLNARLNSLVLCALVFVIGLAIGHFIGSTHERFAQHFQRVDCLDRIKSIQSELLRCAQKYDEVELQLNDMKATLVQKEYVDKWESLYQEGEEEKATLTETLNLYKNRYNKQQQLLEERLDRLKSVQNELLRCVHKYDQLEMKQNEVKATHVQKEYVDKWESLYQEGEEEKAALTATMNLYKSRYNKQKQLLTQCEVRFQDLQEQMTNIKSRKANLRSVPGEHNFVPPTPSPALVLCERRNGALTRRVTDLEKQLKNCTEQLPGPGVIKQLLLFLNPLISANATVGPELFMWPRDLSYLSNTGDRLSNSTKELLAKLQKQFNFTGNITEATGDWLKAAFVSTNHSEKFVEWMTKMRMAINTIKLADVMRRASLAVTDNVEQLFDLLENAMRSVEGANDKTKETTEEGKAEQSFYQRVAEKLKKIKESYVAGSGAKKDNENGGLRKISAVWKKALTSTHAAWNVGVKRAKDVLQQLKTSRFSQIVNEKEEGKEKVTEKEDAGKEEADMYVKRKLTSVDTKREEHLETGGRIVQVMDTDRTETSSDKKQKTIVLERDREGMTLHKLNDFAPETPNVTDTYITPNVSEQKFTSDRLPRKENWYSKRGEARRSLHQTGPDGDWYWRRRHDGKKPKRKKFHKKFSKNGGKHTVFEDSQWTKESGDRMNDVEADDWPEAFWYMQRHMRRAQQRVWRSLNNLHERLALHKWLQKRKRLREKARKKASNIRQFKSDRMRNSKKTTYMDMDEGEGQYI